MGLSFLVPKGARDLTVTVRWGAMRWRRSRAGTASPCPFAAATARGDGASGAHWAVDPEVHDVSGSGGLQLHVVERLISAEDLEEHIPQGTRSISVFLVNHRAANKEEPDLAYAFQPEIEVRSEHAFVPRPDLRGTRSAEWDEQVADLHYADTPEYATGHGVSAEWEVVGKACRLLRTAWIPSAEVEKTATADVPGVELLNGGTWCAGQWSRRGDGAAPARGSVPGLDRGAPA